MRLFLLIFFLIYGGMHVYAFLKAKSAFGFGAGTGVPLALFMGVMIAAPVIVRLLESANHEISARFTAFAGYIWLALLFLFISVSLALDIYHVIVYSGERVLKKDFPHLRLSPFSSFSAALGIAIVIIVYGYFESGNILTERLIIETPKIPRDAERLKIVQISDVHLGLIVGEKRLEHIIEKIKMEHADILVSTGDLVDAQLCGLKKFADLLGEVKTRYGKYAITGNHEFYAGLDRALDCAQKAGFTMLRGEGLTVEGLVNIAGVDDPAGKYGGLYKEVSEKELLRALPREKFTILLKHRPLVDERALDFFDLQLSGHTHKGQIFPFSIVTWLYYPIHAGILNIVDDSYLYVSRGTGTWGPPIRFLSPPEITVIELIPAKERGK